MTPEQTAQQMGFVIPPEEAKRINQMVREEEQKQRKDEMTEIRKARAFACYGDEWGKVASRPVGTDNLQMGIAAGLVDLVTGVTFDNELQAFVRALQPPEVDEFQAQYLAQQFSLPLAVDPKHPQWLIELLGELKTHELDTYRRELKIRPKAREAFRRALVDRACILKDSHYNRERNQHEVEVVIYGDEYYAQKHRDYSKVAWHIHDKQMEKADFAREYPWIIQKYTKDAPVGTKAWFAVLDKFYRTEEREGYIKKSREFQKPYIKVREIWYQMPSERPGAEKFPGGWIILTVFEDEVLRVEANPYKDGKHPFHPIVPLPAEDHWAGKSWIYTQHDGITALNKTASMALFNLVQSCNNVRMWNPSALLPESAERINDTGRIGTVEVVLKHGQTWDNAFKELNPPDVSPSIFAVHNLIQSLVYSATGVSLRREKEVDANGKQVGGDVAMGPQIAMMLDAVKEQHESLFYNLCARGTQFSVGPKAFSLAGEQTVSVMFNPQFYWNLYGDRFFDYFVVQITDVEPAPDNPTERTEDMIARVEAAGKLTEMTGLPLYKSLAVTKPYGYSTLIREVKRQQMEAANDPNRQMTPQEAEKQQIRETEMMKSIAQVWQARMQEKGRDPTQGGMVDQLIASGQLRASLEAAVSGQPFNMPIAAPRPAPAIGQATERVQQSAAPMLQQRQSAPPLNPQMVN
jgi:hypothetical protein